MPEQEVLGKSMLPKTGAGGRWKVKNVKADWPSYGHFRVTCSKVTP